MGAVNTVKNEPNIFLNCFSINAIILPIILLSVRYFLFKIRGYLSLLIVSPYGSIQNGSYRQPLISLLNISFINLILSHEAKNKTKIA